MHIEWSRVLPILVSIGVILVVAFARQYSRTFAVIAAIMPINIPLALWIFSGGDTPQTDLVAFIEGVMIGSIPLFGFLIAAYIAARAGWSVAPIIVSGYAVWGIMYLSIFWLRSLSGGNS